MSEPSSPSLAFEDGFVYMSEITRDLKVTDRGVRKWIAGDRFPPPDGNLNGRNFWKASTYQKWKSDVLAGKYGRQSTLPRAPTAPRAAA
jgi:hypothetical protein